MGRADVSLLVLVFFALLHSVLPLNPQEEDNYKKHCQPFKCGNLGDGEIEFPYANISQPDCGFFVVRNCTEQHQQIRFERTGKWYQVEKITQARELSVTDLEFQNNLKQNSCDSFQNLSLPPFAHVKSNNLTLLKCKNSTVNSSFHNQPALFSHKCPDFIIYYTYPDKNLTNYPPNCELLQLPVAHTTTSNYSDIFRLLSATFSLTLEYDPPEGKKKQFIGIGLGIGIGGTVILGLVIWCLYKRRYASTNLISVSISEHSTLFHNNSNVYSSVAIFSYDELEEATNNFASEGELGDGGFGTVYYGRLRDGREVAVKRLHERNYKKVMQFMNEIEILAHVRHRNLVSLYGCTSRHSRELLLVYEYIPNGTVADHLHGDKAKPGQPSWPVRMRIAIETASALSYLHASDIIHRDIKTNNILLDRNFCVKVADFGISRLFPTDVTHVSTVPQGTPGYLDPEYHQCYQLTAKSDVYSFGVVLIELISSLPAIDITRHRHEINLANFALNKIQRAAFNELIDLSLGYNTDEEVERMTTSVAELAFRCLQQDKEMRPSMNEVLEELEMIEGKGYECENAEEENDNDDKEWKSTELPQHKARDCSEITLLKNIQALSSPTSPMEKWVSKNTTPNNSV